MSPPRLLPLGGIVMLLWGLTSGCTERAEGETPLAVEAEIPTEDPVLTSLLAVPTPAPSAWPGLLAELESALGRATDPRASRSARQEAIQTTDALLSDMRVLEDWRPLVMAHLHAELGETERTGSFLSDPRLPASIADRWALSVQAQAHLARGDTTAALPYLQQVVVSPSAATAEARWAAGILAQGPRVRALGDGMHPDLPRVMGLTLLSMGRLDAGLGLVTPLLETGGDLWLQLEVATALETGGRQAEAIRWLEGMTEAPDLRIRAVTQDRLAGLALARGQLAEARAHVLALEALEPGAVRASQLMALILEQEMTAGRVPANTAGFGPLLTLGIREADGERVKVQTGTRILLHGQVGEAEAFFLAYLEGARTPSARQQALYWLGESRIRGAGSDASARAAWQEAWEIDPLSQYGLMAGERIRAPILPAELAAGPEPQPLDREINAALLRLEAHRYLPIRGSFSFELERIQTHLRTVEGGRYALGEAMVARGFPLQGVVLGRAIHREEGGVWNLRLLRIVHPFPFQEAIEAAAHEYGLDPFLVAGLIRQESLFQPRVRSSAGAVGLMQLMEPTAREMAQAARVPFSTASLTDPAYNARLGSRYLAQMLARHPGRPEDALAAYNAGPGRLRQWQSRPEYRDPAIFREHIPFRETRNYVKVVQQYARIYKALYGCGEDRVACTGLPAEAILELRNGGAARPEPSRVPLSVP